MMPRQLRRPTPDRRTVLNQLPTIRDYPILTLSATSATLYLIPSKIASSGLSGISIIINAISGGVFSGVTSAKAYSVGATGGSTFTLMRILQRKSTT